MVGVKELQVCGGITLGLRLSRTTYKKPKGGEKSAVTARFK
jgi:hypothetical protein